MTLRVSVAMSADVHADLLAHLRVRASASEPEGGDPRVRASASEPEGGDPRVRASASEPEGGDPRVRASASEPEGGDRSVRDGRQNVCLATYRPSTGATRRTAIVTEVITPLADGRATQGNAVITGDDVVRAAVMARNRDEGLVLCHSHPGGRGWQALTRVDTAAERSFANLAREITDLPLVGMTLAGGDGTWSARRWDRGAGGDVACTDAENIRVIGAQLRVSWNDAVVPRPEARAAHRRSISCWGQRLHDDLVRRSVLVVGTGSVGLEVALRLAATGVTRIGLMDFDTVEEHNLDRMIGVTATDVWLRRAKVDIARRLVRENATAAEPRLETWDHSICEAAGARHALDFDMIMCCVDRPWPRAVLNLLAYTDLVPVIDGGIAVDVFPDGGMRNATWRSHVVRPGRPCLLCNGQLDLGKVAAETEGLADDPQYVRGHDGGALAGAGQNVAVLSISTAAALLAQYVSFNIAPGGIGEPGPLQYVLSTNTLEHLPATSAPHCLYEAAEALGDARPVLTGRDANAEERRDERATLPLARRIGRIVDDVAWWWRRRRSSAAARRLRSGGQPHWNSS